MSYYAADGSMNLTVVDGTTYTGVTASDGSTNVIKSDGFSTYVGAHHPCGALWVSLYPGSGISPARAPDGSLVVNDTAGMPARGMGAPVTVVSGSLHPVVPSGTATYYIYGF